MTDYTIDEVLEALRAASNYRDEIYWEELDWFLEKRPDAPGGLTLRDERVPVGVVDSDTGGEGSYDLETFVVFQVGTQYFRKTGHYMSHYGDDWDGPFTEVVPEEKTIIVYQDK